MIEQLFAEFFSAWLYLCGAAITTAGAVAVIIKFWKFAHKTSDQNASTLEEFRGYLANDKRDIEALKSSQGHLEKQNNLQLKALVTLLSHEIDGNHTKQLEDVRNRIQDYLIDEKR